MGILTSSCQNHHLSTKSQLIESQSGKILPHVWAHRLPIYSRPRPQFLGPLSVTHWSATSKFTVGNHWAFTVPERPIHSVLWRPSWKCGAAVAKHSKRQTPQKYWATGASPIARKTFPRVVHGVFNTQLLLRAWHERFLPSGWVWRITTHAALRHWLTQQLQNTQYLFECNLRSVCQQHSSNVALKFIFNISFKSKIYSNSLMHIQD